jgi:hypothetical protein
MKWNLMAASVLSTLAFSMSCAAATQTPGPAAAKASAPAPGLVERTKKATLKAAHATGQAISNTGRKIDAKVPRTEAYKKKHPEKAAPAPAG